MPHPSRTLLVAALALLSACGTGPSEVNPEGGIRGAVAQNSLLSRFAADVEAGPLAQQLQADNITVFAPTDIAYRFLGTEALRRLRLDQDLFMSVLRRHVVTTRVRPEDLVDGAELPTLSGPPLVVEVDGDRVLVGGQEVELDPFDAGNGLLYTVDGFYMDHLDARTRLGLIPLADRFRDALSRANLLSRLESSEPVTVFAPINEAFLQLGGSELDLLFSPVNRDILERVSRLHLAAGIQSIDGPNGTLTVNSLDDYPLVLEAVGGALTYNGVPVYTTPIETSTGVIYLIGRVILDGLTLEQRVRSSSQLRTFSEWAHEQQALLDIMRGTEPHTVFAPTNTAISGVAENVMTALRRVDNAVLFRRVMEMHFVQGAHRSTDLLDGSSVPTLEGSTLEVTNTPTAFRVDGSDIVRRDLTTRNGVLHVVDGLLTPDVDGFDGAILRGIPLYADLMRAAGLEWMLRGAQTRSYIGFTDAVIQANPDLISRPDLLNILRYHMAEGDIGVIFVGMSFVPLEGPPRTVTQFGQLGFVLDSQPFFANLGPVTNGHLYVIGAVAAPPEPRSPRPQTISMASPYE